MPAARAGACLAVAAMLAACAPSLRPPPPDAAAAFPAEWTLPGLEGPLAETASPAAETWRRRGTWEAYDGRTGTIFFGPPMTSPPPLPDLLAALDPGAVPAALPGGRYRVLEAGGTRLWHRRFRRTGQACVAFVRTVPVAKDTGAWGYYCAAPGAGLDEAAIERALGAIRWRDAAEAGPTAVPPGLR